MLNIKETQQLVNAELKKINFTTEPLALYAPIEYTLAQGGKRIRPVLCLMAAQLFGHAPQKVIYPALGLEIFHNFTLLHDDIMDNAEVRRNNPTVHKKWDTNTAILSGDAMMIKAHQFICNCEDSKLPKVITLFNEVALGVCEGQQYDMEFETRKDVSVEDYIKMISLKTAILLAGSLKMGAILANASEEEADLIYQFGMNIGLAFQLQDDYLDTFGNQDTFGKKIGGDIIANKKTFLLLTALKKAEKEDKRNLINWITVEHDNHNLKIEEVKKIYQKLAVDTDSKNKMNEYYEKAIQCLGEIKGNESVKKELKNFASQLMQRIN
ncbi:polyprenyl synthetase family protein [Saccharicrinis fermentans]|uniref:Heptaprenyl diphosphate synthase component 2 n=1 Tax=Saccharicrinis fermentans DSM 9555 = JCM 21142 TaxID=869213 RepID=W7YBK3_9BACT|nr:polyprenyl synthetase family protein [Saccharicrinis fermentans]GAF01821.1 heptaprenyl diphosphate synthase component 2 [Saccharicrinis fermentans DSM 9555 = JCM 21142]